MSVGQPYSLDVTSLVNQAMNANGLASFQITATSAPDIAAYVEFASSNNGTAAWRPTLSVLTSSAGPSAVVAAPTIVAEGTTVIGPGGATIPDDGIVVVGAGGTLIFDGLAFEKQQAGPMAVAAANVQETGPEEESGPEQACTDCRPEQACAVPAELGPVLAWTSASLGVSASGLGGPSYTFRSGERPFVVPPLGGMPARIPPKGGTTNIGHCIDKDRSAAGTAQACSGLHDSPFAADYSSATFDFPAIGKKTQRLLPGPVDFLMRGLADCGH